MGKDTKTLGVAVAGLGTVGVGLVRILEQNAALISARTGCALKLVAVSARDRSRDRGIDISDVAWCDNAVDLAAQNGVDIVVELMGGSDGPALALARETLSSGKAFVTANKALIAVHGHDLAALAEEHDAALKFEASVAGGIPIIKALGEGLAANQISSVFGILNGTCNYILTRMESENLAFAEVLEQAQKLGYAEADPSFDVDGIDTAHKTAILGALAFGTVPAFDAMTVEGIRHIEPIDIAYAAELGYRIKLLGVARKSSQGLEQRVHPAMVPLDAALAAVGGAINAVVVEGDHVGQTVYEGAGAGMGPTASAVVADIIDIARGNFGPAFGVVSTMLENIPFMGIEKHHSRFYIRLSVLDQPGVIADITGILRDEAVSIDSLIQHGEASGDEVFVIMTTHTAPEAAMVNALAKVEKLEAVTTQPTMIRIEDL